MKRLMYAASVTFACMSALSLNLVSASSHSIAYAAEEVCEFTFPAATGGAIQQHIDTIAHCNVRNDATVQMGTSPTIKSMLPNQINSTPANAQETIDPNRALCPTLPLGTTAEDFQYREILERCKYGS